MTISSNVKLIGLILGFILLVAVPAILLVMDVEEKEVSKGYVEVAVQNYLREHPEAVIEAINAYTQQQQEEHNAKAKEGLKAHKKAVMEDQDTPVAGNKNGSKVVVEFFDYSCGYCRKAMPAVAKLTEQHKDVKLLLKEFPILSPVSEMAAKAALAVHRLAPDQYFNYHKALMSTRVTGRQTLLDEARKLGVDTVALEKEMEKKEITEILNKNRTLARNIGIQGTPAFIINDELIPGAISYEEMAEKVK